MTPQFKNALAEGVVDALGFVAGGLAGALLGRLIGADYTAEQGWGTTSMIGVLLVGLGAGLGRTGARKLLRRTEPSRH